MILSLLLIVYYTHLQRRAKRLQSGGDVSVVDYWIRHHEEAMVKCEEVIEQRQRRLLEMEQEEGWSD